MGLIFKILQKIIAPFLFFLFIRSIFADFSRAQQRARTRRDWGSGTGAGSSRSSWDGGSSAGSGFGYSSPSAYEVLGLPRGATNEEIRSRYRELIVKYHPDKFAGLNYPEFTKLAAEKFQKIQGAYEELKRQRGI